MRESRAKEVVQAGGEGREWTRFVWMYAYFEGVRRACEEEQHVEKRCLVLTLCVYICVCVHYL